MDEGVGWADADLERIGMLRIDPLLTDPSSLPMLDRKFIVENAELVKQNCRAAACKVDVDRFVALEGTPQDQASRNRTAQSPGERSLEVDRQGQGPGRAGRAEGRRPAAPRADRRYSGRTRCASPPSWRRSNARFPTCRIPPPRSARRPGQPGTVPRQDAAADVRFQAAGSRANWPRSST